MVDDWFDTGDTYRRDGGGHFYYCGRSDDMMKVGGIWCSPFEIESKLVEHPDVLKRPWSGAPTRTNLLSRRLLSFSKMAEKAMICSRPSCLSSARMDLRHTNIRAGSISLPSCRRRLLA